MAYLLYMHGDTETDVVQSSLLDDKEAKVQETYGIGPKEKLLPVADALDITAQRIATVTVVNGVITAVTYVAAVAMTTAQIRADARFHLRNRMDEMQYIWGPLGQRWRNCRLWLLSMAAVIGGICDVIDDSTHSQHANWAITDAIDALAAAKALAPEVIPAARLALLTSALSLTPPVDPQGVRFWYFGHSLTGWRGYFGAVSATDPTANLSPTQAPHFAWGRGESIPAFASDASTAAAWDSVLGNRLDLEFNAGTADVEDLLA